MKHHTRHTATTPMLLATATAQWRGAGRRRPTTLHALACTMALLAGCTTALQPSHADTATSMGTGTSVGTVAASGTVWPVVAQPQPMHPPQQPHQAGWPQHRPWTASWLDRPNFQAPSATHCARPIQTTQWPVQTQHPQPVRPYGYPGHLSERERAETGTAEAKARAESLHDASREHAARSRPAPLASAAPSAAPAVAPPAAPPTAATLASPPPPAAAGAAVERVAPGADYMPTPPRQRQPQTGPVTAGMVDDNADFGAYLAFRDRTRVAHHPRDVRERHLLQVSDASGRPLADAEVAVQAESGHAMWARTDTAGRVWIHPDAFDPARSHTYRVTARQHGAEGSAWLTRGQKNAVDLRLGSPVAAQRARLDLVFLIDATGSMADEIHKLKVSLQSIVSELTRLPSQPDLCLGLVAYRDEGDAFTWRRHDLTHDVGAFQGVLNQLRADGGGDYPEAMSEALHQTVHQINWRGDGATRLVVLLADAPPQLHRGGPRYDEDMLAALGKGIKVFSVGASGLDRQGEYIQRQIAQYTGGRFVFLTYADARRPASGPGSQTVHDVNNYSVDTLDRLIVRLVSDELGRLASR